MNPAFLPQHLVLHAHGDLPRRLEACPLHGCRVDDQGLTTCQHLACAYCGVGPPVHVEPEGLLLCEHCGRRWLP